MTTDWKVWWKNQEKELPKKHPILLFEGCDGSGKTTVQNILTNIIKHAFLVHTSAPTGTDGKDYFYSVLVKLIELMDTLHQPVFFDRFHIGELVYGSIFRPHTIDEGVEQKMYSLERELMQRDAKLIYVTASPDTIMERVNKRGDWYIKSGNVEHILNVYKQKISLSQLPVFILDTTDNISEEDIHNLLWFIYGMK